MNPEPGKPQNLPEGLTATVRVVEGVLGRVVAEAEGDALYETVEAIRQDMVALREAGTRAGEEEALDRAAARLGALSTEEKSGFARAYTLYLQLVNICENAYRTHRLRRREASASTARARLTFVLTAHPTESRSPENIGLLRRAQDLLTGWLDRGRGVEEREIGNLLHLAWRTGTHPPRKPSVEDEANHLFSLLTDPILNELITLTEAGHRVLLRTWVGGDKDGHPGVGPEQTEASLQRSRQRMLSFVERQLLPLVREDVRVLGETEPGAALEDLETALRSLQTVGAGDGGRVANLRSAVDAFQAAYRSRLGVEHPAVGRMRTLLGIFGALVVPLELREERGRFGSELPIAAMMERLKAIASGGPVEAYARAVVVSMTTEAVDLLQAQELVEECFGAGAIPVIPLFELPEVLVRATAILDQAWQDPGFQRAARERGHVEVMLGYSDTAKRMGMLASRVALHDAMREVGAWAEARDITPRFFHGHGGSVGRGGGRIEDLAATWPPLARTPYKYTLQGEMVERTLASPEILRSLVEKVAAVQEDPPPYRDVGELARSLAADAKQGFETRVASEAFRGLLECATPYTRLQALTIGSRPARRGDGGLEELRAIPWVLCWTQTRLLLHAWLGVGQAWRVGRESEGMDERLAQARENDPLFRSWARLLSFTMAKTEPILWHRYRRALSGAAPEQLATELEGDFEAAVDLACRAGGADTLLPERPWLAESIRYRAPMIHPLNLLQIELLTRSEWTEAEVELFRETVTGIAAGMLTTG